MDFQSVRGTVRIFKPSYPPPRAFDHPWPFRSNHVLDRLLPKLPKPVLLHALAGGPCDPAPLLLVFQVMVQQFLQIVAGVLNALLAVAEVRRHFAVAGLLNEQGPRGGRLEGALVALAADGPVEDDAGAAQERA